MAKILGLDLGTTSIGWALVNYDKGQDASIVKLGVRVNPLTTDEQQNFEKGKSITTNADRTSCRSARRNLQRYKLRRLKLIEILTKSGLITDNTLLCENGNNTTFETYELRAKAAEERVELSEFARILLQINKKRGYKSSRKDKTSTDEGQLIDGMSVAKILHEKNITAGQYVYKLLSDGRRYAPDFYSSDLKNELDRVWSTQSQFHPHILTESLRAALEGKSKLIASKVFYTMYKIGAAENRGKDKIMQSYKWRADAISGKLSEEELVYVICDLCGSISNASGYLATISDRSKELYFNHLTVGQYQMMKLRENPNYSLRNQVFYRQDYFDEFNSLWDVQSDYHSELTDALKAEIRNVIIFYQRRLKSQKGLISLCEFENRDVEICKNGKTIMKNVGLRVAPRSSHLFQEFMIWQTLNNVIVSDKKGEEKRRLEQEEMELLFQELNYKNSLSKSEILKILFGNHRDLDLNFKEIKGNQTNSALIAAYQKVIAASGNGEYNFSKMSSREILNCIRHVFGALGFNLSILDFDSNLEDGVFERQPLYCLWHLLYSFEGDNTKSGNSKLIHKIMSLGGFDRDSATIISNVIFQDDYCSLSAKAIRKILPYLKSGNDYALACEYAGYRHSKSSLTKEEIKNKVLKDELTVLPKNSLRNPVVEKILNQMVHVVNGVIKSYGAPDEIHIELARELKNSAKEREELSKIVNDNNKKHIEYTNILRRDFGLNYVSRNDLIRYKLYLELEKRGYKTLYTNTYISREKLFSKEFDIEHIIPKAKLYDDSFSNKTLEKRDANIEKGDATAYDYMVQKDCLNSYLAGVDELYQTGAISKSKYNKLKMREEDIPSGFIERDLRDTQYIAKKAKTMLEEISPIVLSTTGLVTSRLREDWQLIELMKELNWDKYASIGLTERIERRDGQESTQIKDWSKRNDHRHHAMDALTVAFTRHNHIQYLNNKKGVGGDSIILQKIESKELYRDDKRRIRFVPPMPLSMFREEAKRHLEDILVSIKAKNKVVTKNINYYKSGNTTLRKEQLTPRGQLHKETVYGSSQSEIVKVEKIGSTFNTDKIMTVTKPSYRDALLGRLHEYGDDAKKAFTGKNSLTNRPLYIDKNETISVPLEVKTRTFETIYSVRKSINPNINLDKVVDVNVRNILTRRLSEYGGDPKKAFVGLDENPIWMNREKGISIKSVTVSDINNVESLHSKRDHQGNLILDIDGNTHPKDFVSTGNNHHVAIYRDENGNLQERIVSFFEATALASQGQSVIDKEYGKSDGWEFLYTMKQNEYFVFPNAESGFDPTLIDLMDPANATIIGKNLYRVQKISTKDYYFRHHLETNTAERKELLGITYKRCSLKGIAGIVKIRVNHIGQVVSVGE